MVHSSGGEVHHSAARALNVVARRSAALQSTPHRCRLRSTAHPYPHAHGTVLERSPAEHVRHRAGGVGLRDVQIAADSRPR
jgi:hypothetical protein